MPVAIRRTEVRSRRSVPPRPIRRASRSRRRGPPPCSPRTAPRPRGPPARAVSAADAASRSRDAFSTAATASKVRSERRAMDRSPSAIRCDNASAPDRASECWDTRTIRSDLARSTSSWARRCSSRAAANEAFSVSQQARARESSSPRRAASPSASAIRASSAAISDSREPISTSASRTIRRSCSACPRSPSHSASRRAASSFRRACSSRRSDRSRSRSASVTRTSSRPTSIRARPERAERSASSMPSNASRAESQREGHLETLPGGDAEIEVLQFRAERLVPLRLPDLPLERPDLAPDLVEDVLHAGEVLAGALHLPLRLFPPDPELGDPRGLLDDHAHLVRPGIDDLADLPLGDDGVSAGAGARVEEQFGDVLQAARNLVDGEFALAVAEGPARDRDLGVRFVPRRGVPVVVHEGEGYFGHPQGTGGIRAGEDDVFERLAAKIGGGVLAEDPADGVDDVRLAASVRADDRRDPGGKIKRRLVVERLETDQFQFFQFHRYPMPDARRIGQTSICCGRRLRQSQYMVFSGRCKDKKTAARGGRRQESFLFTTTSSDPSPASSP